MQSTIFTVVVLVNLTTMKKFHQRNVLMDKETLYITIFQIGTSEIYMEYTEEQMGH